ncbi:MAG: dihydrofolate reductase [Clostridia bacterium]|nr:dihydrofolate reductase [Clostridia bacterium]
MKLVVAVDKEWGIGYKGGLLAAVKADLAHFRELTVGKTVVLGSTTLKTFPGGRPLKNRKNLILSRNPDFAPEGATVLRSVKEVLDYQKEHPEQELVVIGGASIYEQMLPYCDTAYVTLFEASFKKDTYFPNLDADPHWQCVQLGQQMKSTKETDTVDGMTYRFATYKRTN